jgi:NHL repeat-containing protein
MNSERMIPAMVALLLCSVAAGSDLDEFKIKREAVYEFVQKPSVKVDGDRVTISFTSKALCDATVVVQENSAAVRPRIIRHLASGVLGKNAPAPFKKNSKKQSIVWDGKDDTGKYVDDKDALTIRVSLGLKPQFERTLFWSPRRRQSRMPQLVCATKEGVYVYDGGTGIDHLRLFDHKGNYVRTVYPFPANKIKETQGLAWHTFPQDNATLPLKTNFLQCTMLTSGPNAYNTQTYQRDKKIYRSVIGTKDNAHYGMYGAAASAMAMRNGRIMLAHRYLNRLNAGALPLQGPRTSIDAPLRRTKPKPTVPVSPRSAALSPDGKWLYLTGYIYGRRGRASQDIQYTADWRCVPAVMRLNVETGEKMELFKGSTDPNKHGTDNDHFKVPSSVAVDRAGRVYVADHVNNRVQIFSPAGKFLKTIPVKGAAKVAIHQRTGDIYVFSWKVMNEFETGYSAASLHQFGPFGAPKKKSSWLLGRQEFASAWASRYRTAGIEFYAELDGWTDPATIWLTTEGAMEHLASRKGTRMNYGNLMLLQPRGSKLEPVRQFANDVARAKIPQLVQSQQRQRLYVNPVNGRVNVAEGDSMASGKSFNHVFELVPETGKIRRVELPFHAEDMCFDLKGLAYLRTVNVVARYNPKSWREVPWDYGEEMKKIAFGWHSGTRFARVVAGVMMPSDGGWHHGGMHVSAGGKLVVGCLLGVKMNLRTDARYVHAGKKYEPRVYPGRLLGGRGGATCVHVWDQHGKIVSEDIIPGLADLYGVGIDAKNNIYVMSAATRVLDGKLHFNDMTGTVMKFAPGKGRVITTSKRIPVPLSKAGHLKRPFDVRSSMQGSAWVEDAEWMYGGVGFGGKNLGIGCACWNFRFAHDYLARTFAPEMDRYSVAVLDSAGNLITRIGKYGNVDDGVPLIPHRGLRKPRSIGGDEVALFHGAYLATDTDRRLFIADPGNLRVLSVKLGYHTSGTVRLGAAGKAD